VVAERREPGGTELGERVRERLLAEGRGLGLGPRRRCSRRAARQMVEQVIATALERDADVICAGT